MKKSSQTEKLVVGALLSALVVVLQLVAGYIKVGPAPITLTLAPIIIGGAVYGVGMGALLGLVFAIAVLIEPGTAVFYSINVYATVGIVILKGVLGGLAAAASYKLLSKKSELLGVISAGIVLPIVNTGIFVLGSSRFFVPAFPAAAGKQGFAIFAAIFVGIAINFAVELGVNLILSTGITTAIKAIRRK